MSFSQKCFLTQIKLYRQHQPKHLPKLGKTLTKYLGQTFDVSKQIESKWEKKATLWAKTVKLTTNVKVFW